MRFSWIKAGHISDFAKGSVLLVITSYAIEGVFLVLPHWEWPSWGRSGSLPRGRARRSGRRGSPFGKPSRSRGTRRWCPGCRLRQSRSRTCHRDRRLSRRIHERLLKAMEVFKKFWRTLVVLFVGQLISVFWTSGDVWPVFQSQGGFLVCVLCHLRAMDSSDSPLVWHLLTFSRPATEVYFGKLS